MRFWIREIVGWLLALLALCVFYICFPLLLTWSRWRQRKEKS